MNEKSSTRKQIDDAIEALISTKAEDSHVLVNSQWNAATTMLNICQLLAEYDAEIAKYKELHLSADCLTTDLLNNKSSQINMHSLLIKNMLKALDKLDKPSDSNKETNITEKEVGKVTLKDNYYTN